MDIENIFCDEVARIDPDAGSSVTWEDACTSVPCIEHAKGVVFIGSPQLSSSRPNHRIIPGKYTQQILSKLDDFFLSLTSIVTSPLSAEIL